MNTADLQALLQEATQHLAAFRKATTPVDAKRKELIADFQKHFDTLSRRVS